MNKLETVNSKLKAIEDLLVGFERGPFEVFLSVLYDKAEEYGMLSVGDVLEEFSKWQPGCKCPDIEPEDYEYGWTTETFAYIPYKKKKLPFIEIANGKKKEHKGRAVYVYCIEFEPISKLKKEG